MNGCLQTSNNKSEVTCQKSLGLGFRLKIEARDSLTSLTCTTKDDGTQVIIKAYWPLV